MIVALCFLTIFVFVSAFALPLLKDCVYHVPVCVSGPSLSLSGLGLQISLDTPISLLDIDRNFQNSFWITDIGTSHYRRFLPATLAVKFLFIMITKYLLVSPFARPLIVVCLFATLFCYIPHC